MNEQCMIPVVKTLADYRAYRIRPDDTNRLAIVFDPDCANDSLTVCVEIFEVASQTPIHRHNFAVEMFFILKGEGLVVCDGKETILHTGDSVLIPKRGTHCLKNIGNERLYALCIMSDGENFAELIRNGIPAPLDEYDLQVLSRIS